ncbi:MAG: hypothetical protein IPL13_16880 [Saprospiraceae bacterium]|nr:hypothetical protein [Candidatus Brachybacter algidus]
MEFIDNLNNLIEEEKVLGIKSIDKLKSLGHNFDVVYLPNFMPTKKVDYFFVAMEPSFGKWGTVDNANKLISKGFRNFIFSKGDYLLHFAINKYLTSNYHITDVSKSAMNIDSANVVRKVMYNFWRPHLKKEFETLKTDSAKIISIGDKPEIELQRIFPNSDIHKIIHFSGAAQKARKEFVEKHNDEFQLFAASFIKEEVQIFSQELFNSKIEDNEVKSFIQKHSFKRLVDIKESDLRLLFNYKMNFEKILKN